MMLVVRFGVLIKDFGLTLGVQDKTPLFKPSFGVYSKT